MTILWREFLNNRAFALDKPAEKDILGANRYAGVTQMVE